jgi:hypothetical protein
MAIRVVPYTAEWVAAVLAFNERMHGSGWGWYGSPVDSWLPERTGKRTWREHWLAIEDGVAVRGGYGLRPQEWWIRGAPQLVTDWQGPVTEGLINRRYSALGIRLLREMLRQYPLLYSWGHGGLEQPMLQMLEKLGWLLHPTPFCVRILHPFRFLRRNLYLRGTFPRRLALDLAALTGVGSLAAPVLHAGLGAGHAREANATAREFERFAAWADELWERCLPRYAAIATRDADTMNTLLVPGRWPPCVRLRIERDGATLGWVVVMDTVMQDDPRFGSLRVGSVVDVLAEPADAEAVVGAAFRYLRSRPVDLVVSNQAHPAWALGFAAHGFLRLRGRRTFAASPALHAALEPFAETSLGLHLTNMDGHGPHAL